VNLRKPAQATVLVLGELTSDQPGWVAIQPEFEVRDASNITLLRFETHGATYAGGFSGDVKAMIHGFAVSVAHTVRRWSQSDLPE
jgi:hypothetical protein